MGIIKDIYGATTSALITGGLFLGPAIAGLLYSLIPPDMVDVLAVDDRPPVYFDAAFELAEVEIDGDLDGTTDKDSPESADGEGDGGDPDSDTKPEDANTSGSSGSELAIDKTLAVKGAGRRVGDKVGSGRAAAGKGKGGRKRKRSRRRCPREYDGVVLRQDGVYEIDRRLLNYYTSSIKHFNELGWSKPNDAGKGWIISGFNCQGPLWHGGMRRGDIVMTVNGKKTNNMLQVLRLYPKLKAQRRFEVKVIRKGRHVTLRYEVVRG